MAAARRINPDLLLKQLSTRHAGLVREWFGDLRVVGLERGEVVVRAASRDQAEYLERYCRPAFIEGAQTATGRLVGVRFTYRNGSPAATPVSLPGPACELPLRLNADYTFGTFIAGPCNRLAHAAAVSAADAPGRVYNPLYICGPAGVGKSHLAQAVCHRLLDRSPGLPVAYLSCDAFARAYVESLAKDAVHPFQDRYRSVEVLVMEDAQALGEQERCQEEVFHTFNALHQEQRQIIVTANGPPERLAGVPERLASRFQWGLVVEMELPCLETRAALVRAKAAARGLNMPDEVIGLLAGAIEASARELEGAVARVQNRAESTGEAITVELAQSALGLTEPELRRNVRMSAIIGAVARYYGVTRDDLRGPKRGKSLALPRQVCMYLARRLTRHSQHEIGHYFCDRDHTTVLHAERLVAERSGTDSQLRQALGDLEAELRQR